MFVRYAVYATPDGALGAAGATWLGWDIAQGAATAQPEFDGLDLAQATRRPRRYGFHATIKPPMALAQGVDPAALLAAATDCMRPLPPVVLPGLAITRMGRFLALTPTGDTRALDTLAARVVETLDPLRAPLSPDAFARRQKPALTPTQAHNLRRWGYPHVMDAFRFHITLTGPLNDAQAGAALHAAQRHFAPALSQPVTLAHLTLAGEDAQGMFHALAPLPLRG